MDYRERLARHCLRAVRWIWQACLFLNPYTLWRSDELWSRCTLWFCALKSRLLVDAAKKQQLLDWVSSKVPSDRPPTNLGSDWKDGILLCALLDALVPGACPRFDLLNPDNAATNADMAIKLIERHLGVKVSVTADELVECSAASEFKLMVLLSQLKLASAKCLLRKTKCIPVTRGPDLSQEPFFQPNEECAAKGMGLMLAVKGRKACFNIYLRSTAQLNIVIEIRGPANSLCSERITDRSPKRKVPIRASTVAAIAFASRGPKTVRSNSLNDVMDVDKRATKIPFEYEVTPGKVAVGYIPTVTGKHKLSIIWQGQHIMGSPYVVTVDESGEEHPDAKPKPCRRLPMPFRGSDGSESPSHSPPSTPPLYAGNLRPDLNGIATYGPVPEAARLSPTRTRRLGTVTRRRVLRHIVKVDGKDMVIEDSSPEEFASAVQALRNREPNFSKRPLNRQFSLDAKWDVRAKHVNGSFSAIHEVEDRDELGDSVEAFDLRKWMQSNGEQDAKSHRGRTASAPESMFWNSASELKNGTNGLDVDHLLSSPKFYQPRKVSFEDEESEMSMSVSSGMTSDPGPTPTDTKMKNDVFTNGHTVSQSSNQFEPVSGTTTNGEEINRPSQSKELRQWFQLIDEAQKENIRTKREEEKTDAEGEEAHTEWEEKQNGETRDVPVVNGRPTLEAHVLEELMEVCAPLIANRENRASTEMIAETCLVDEEIRDISVQMAYDVACVEVEEEPEVRQVVHPNAELMSIPRIEISVPQTVLEEVVRDRATSLETESGMLEGMIITTTDPYDRCTEENYATEPTVLQMENIEKFTSQQDTVTQDLVDVSMYVEKEEDNAVVEEVLVVEETHHMSPQFDYASSQLMPCVFLFPENNSSLQAIAGHDKDGLLVNVESEEETFAPPFNERDNTDVSSAHTNQAAMFDTWTHEEDSVHGGMNSTCDQNSRPSIEDGPQRLNPESEEHSLVDEQPLSYPPEIAEQEEEWVVVSEGEDQKYVVELTEAPRSLTPTTSDIDMFPSVERRTREFEERFSNTRGSYHSEQRSPDACEGTFWASPVRPASSFDESMSPSLDLSLASRSQSQGSLSRAGLECQPSSFNKTKEFWEKSNMSKSESNVLSARTTTDVQEETAEFRVTVRERMMFWENMSESPKKPRPQSFSPLSRSELTRPGGDTASGAEWNSTETDGPSVDLVTEAQQTCGSPVLCPDEVKNVVVVRLGSPGSEGTADSGVCVRGPSAYRKERRVRSKSVPAPPVHAEGGEVVSSRTRKSGYGAPFTFIYRQNPLFSLDGCCQRPLADECSVTDTSVTELTDDRGFIDDEIPDYASILMDKYVSFTGLLENDRCLSRRELLGLDFPGDADCLAFREPLLTSDSSALLPRASVCRVYGAGVYYGQVGTRNHFQVGTRGAGKGCLTVSVQGPGQHDVNEVVVAYAGDQIYEVMYDVAEPGYYVISVKWSEWNIPESPFICKVTY